MSQSSLVLDLSSTLDLPDSGIGKFSFAERVQILKQHGIHSQAFSTLQPNMEYFDVPGIGYIAFMRQWSQIFVLADPVSAPEQFPLMLELFNKRFPSAVYLQVTKPVAAYLNERHNFYGTQLGSEIRIDLAKWSLSGKKKQVIRTALNQSEKQGITVQERYSDDHTREISDAWIKTRKCKKKEIRFFIRPMQMEYKENERHFYAYQDGKAVGFVYFDPIYKNNEIISYVPNISRACADFKQGIFYTLIVHAMEQFKAEGVPFLDLGLVPLMFDGPDEPQESKLLKKALRLTYEKGNFLYNFKGLEFTKSRFRGDVHRIYTCHRRGIPALEFLTVFKLARLI
ncbi:DUF2156 domain-containing protein [Allohahella marinimesophila]|uniref:Phosphatidylglycerol lysyltransferase C-terminal domain-containing protein n=1 Tax=Allohahella marinimesophila TaxID=1054972 RepID=A0ABP7NR37_9GAMM